MLILEGDKNSNFPVVLFYHHLSGEEVGALLLLGGLKSRLTTWPLLTKIERDGDL